MEEGIIINRISSQRQDDGYSLTQQSKINRTIAKEFNCKIVGEFSIIESARNSEKRNEFREAINQVKKNRKIKYIFLEKIDRLTRNLMDQALAYDLIYQYGVTLYFTRDRLELSPTSRSSDKLNFDMRAIMAKNYVDNLSEEVKKGQRGMIEEGKWPGGSSPLGYIKQNKLLFPDFERAKFIRMAYEMYSAGNLSLRILKNKLDKEGFRSRSNKLVTKSNLHKILTNPIYYGDILWNGEIYKGIHEPLVDRYLFEKVQSMLRRTKNGEVVPVYSKHDFTYRGVLQCGECKSKITAEEKTKQNKGNGKIHRWIYYHCTHFKKCSQKGSAKEEDIETQIVALFGKLHLGEETTKWLKKMLKESHFEEIKFRQQSLSSLNLRNIQIQDLLDKLYDDKIDGVIDDGTYRRKREQYLAEQSDILEKIKQHSVADKEYVDFGSLILDVANRAAEIYKVRNQEEKRYLLKLVFSNLSLEDKKLQISFNSVFEALFNYQETKDVLPSLDSNQNKRIQSPLSYH